ncbi:cell wall-associated NlpC family hydrolase [Streptomyces sp. TLI_235]|nr:NlpC/P60 family protein [Streptomyces sp. TLI_235]PBC75968.1 cell wall-associated NlpC family hydrolase [Streptomyces sp. TLI_235]
MPRYSAEQIYGFARLAGFAPDQAATMTAVALAESGGDSRAHNAVGEDSRGLWQINARAHPDLAARYDLYDPEANARAAFEVSHQGADVSPWTTTHHSLAARYLRFRDEAEAAAVAHGDGAGRGMWTGTTGYGDHRGAAAAPPGAPEVESGADTEIRAGTDHTAATPPTPAAPTPAAPTSARLGAEYGIPLDQGGATPAGRAYGLPVQGEEVASPPVDAAPAHPDAGGDRLSRFVDAALAQNGDRYVYGAEADLDDPNPSAFDCSELVQWAAHRAGLDITDGAVWQYRQVHEAGTTMSVEEALHTRGALLFSFNSDPLTGEPGHQHVAISLGDGHTIEAHGSATGVGIFEASAKRFNYAAMPPGTTPPGAAGSGPDHAPSTVPADPPPADAAHPAPEQPAAGADGHAYSAGPAAPDDFADRLAVDPDQLDRQTLAASLEYLGPTDPLPPPDPEPLPPPPVDHLTADHFADHTAHWDTYGVEIVAAHDPGTDGGHDATHHGY